MIVDTDVLIDVQRNYPPALVWFADWISRLEVPGYVVMELVQSARNSHEVRTARTLILPLPIIWPDEVACGQGLDAYTHLHLSHGLGLIDALIAATAVSCGVPLATHNAKHYAAYPGLTIIKPYAKQV